MTIDVTTRSVKGSPLTFTEMDTNFDNLSVSSSEAAEGNIEIADQAETDALSDALKAVVPAYLEQTTENIITASTNVPRNTSFVSGRTGELVDTETGVQQKWGRLDGTTSVSFAGLGLANHASVNYNVVLSYEQPTGISVDSTPMAHTKTANGFQVFYNTGFSLKINWHTIGL